MVRRWDSIPKMRRLSWAMVGMAVSCMVIGLASWPITLIIAVPALVLGTTAVLLALFAWFRFDHLRELDRLRRPRER